MEKNKQTLFISLVSIALLAFITVFSATNYQTDKQMLPFFKGDPYKDLWAKVDSFDKKGLPKSAIEVVEKIYEKASADANQAQQVKSIVFLMRYTSEIEEEPILLNMKRLETEIQKAGFPLKSMLLSLQAQIYWQYYQQNSWKFSNRSETVDFDNDDVATWDLNKLAKTIIKLNLEALEPADDLKRVSISVFSDVLTGDTLTRNKRPTFYDFIAHRALDFFQNDALFLDEPVYKFQLAGAGYFAPSSEFSRLKIETRDSMSLRFYAIRLLQDMVAFHLNDDQPDALVDAELIRLSFVRNNSTLEEKDAPYIAALEDLEKRTIKSKASTQVSYFRATYHKEKGDNYSPAALETEGQRYESKKALEICNEAIARFKEHSLGAVNCEALRLEILAKSISLTIEGINPSNQPFRALVSYKNVDKLYFRVVELVQDDLKKLASQKTEDDIKFLRGKNALQKWTRDLTKEDDFQDHSAEVKIPGLGYGLYAVMAATTPDFSYAKEAVIFSLVTVSDLAYLIRNNPTKGQEIFVTDRNMGAPLEGVEITAWSETYDYNKRAYVTNKIATLKSDKDGFALLPAPEKSEGNGNVYFSLKYKNDFLDTRSRHYRYKTGPSNHPKTVSTHFFTDRSIYRPGQTVYFKGIVIENEGESRTIMKGYKSHVRFLDVNYQEIAKIDLTTNEYGSFHGSFVAPLGVLTGNMQITDSHGSVYVSVEEYKRPKFEVKFNPVTESFKLGEKVTVTGNAKAYAGSNIDGAEVKYRVVREARFPWCWWWRGYFPSSPAMEITSGTSVTDETGTFEISFDAVPDASIQQKLLPEFSYTVYADVVDITGETRSSQTWVKVGHIALSMSVNLPAASEKSALKKIKLYSQNLNGQFEPAKGKITIHQLKNPERVLRSRLWGRPDRFLMDRATYEQNFPEDIYDNENQIADWEKGPEVFAKEFDTKKADSVALPDLKKWQEGQYVFELTTADKYGKEVKILKYFVLYDIASKSSLLSDPDWFTAIKTSVEPGENGSLAFATAYKDFSLLYEREFKGEITHREWVKLSNEKRLFEIETEEKHRGGFGYLLTAIHSGRVYSHSGQIYVPWSNKQLKLEWETFRNKLQPGQEEEWRLTLKGPKGELQAAEMVATLYDASLDAFRGHGWYLGLWPYRYHNLRWEFSGQFSTVNATLFSLDWNAWKSRESYRYEEFNWFGYYFWSYRNRYLKKNGRDYSTGNTRSADFDDEGGRDEFGEAEEIAAPSPAAESLKDLPKGGVEDARKETGLLAERKPSEDGLGDGQTGEDLSGVQVRTNLNETAFFFPDLKTDEKGNIVLSFTMPEALTRWKFLGLAHTQDLKVGYLSGETVTQKELMVMPNPPRFLREGDRIGFTAKVSNLSEKDLEGTVVLQLFNAMNMQPIDAEFGNKNPRQAFSVKKGLSQGFEWSLKIPEGIQAVTWRVVAKAGTFSDGEESALPVLTNRMLVTESMPLPLRPKQTREFAFTKLLNNKSTTLRHHKLTLEFTSNPAWYAVQALPYLMEYPYECSEQVFSRFYANSLATHIANSSPKIKQVFESWKTRDKEALLSNLEKNQELKALLLEETPWVLNAQDESERKKRVGLLFDLNMMSRELTIALKKLMKAQVSNGGWPWFPGMPESRYITQHVVTGMGHLDHLGVKNVREDQDTWNMVTKAIGYLDTRIREDYDHLVRLKVDLSKDHLGSDQIQYLYARSYFPDVKIDSRNQKAFEYYRGQAVKYWLSKGKYMQGMIALGLDRFEKEQNLDAKKVPMDIIRSLKEKALNHDELGMYWAENTGGYYWYQAPIEMHALMIEAFDEVAGDQVAVEEMKIWLLKQKQTQDWKTTKATVEACYALLLRGTELLAESQLPVITVGGKLIDPTKMEDLKVEAGTGYFKTSWSGGDIKSEMGKVKVENRNQVVAWGALYWQYFEQLDKITPHETPLKLKKEVFLEQNSDRGPVIKPVTEGMALKPGDLLKIRIELRVDRDMEYLHMKDMRASGFEPINVLSRYKYQDGLGYYESTRDAATNFFIGWLPRGTYVFEYPLRVQHKGNFSNGITTIQCMYAPEFTSHSEGIRIEVK